MNETRCNNCERLGDSTDLYSKCLMTQPSGDMCSGTFMIVEPNENLWMTIKFANEQQKQLFKFMMTLDMTIPKLVGQNLNEDASSLGELMANIHSHMIKE